MAAEKLTKQEEAPVVDAGANATLTETTPKRSIEDDINELKSSIAGLADSVRSISTPPVRTEQPATGYTTSQETTRPGILPGEPSPEQLQSHFQQIRRAADEQGLDGEFVANNELSRYNAARAKRLDAAAEEKARSHFHSVASKYPNYKESEAAFMNLIRQSDPTAILMNQKLPDGSEILDVLLDRAQGKVTRERFSAGAPPLRAAEPPPETSPKSAGAIPTGAGKTITPRTRTKQELEWMNKMGVTEEMMQIEEERYGEVA